MSARETRKFASFIVKTWKRGGALTVRQLGGLLVYTEVNAWLAGYEQAKEDFYSLPEGYGDSFPEWNSPHYLGMKSAQKRVRPLQ